MGTSFHTYLSQFPLWGVSSAQGWCLEIYVEEDRCVRCCFEVSGLLCSPFPFLWVSKKRLHFLPPLPPPLCASLAQPGSVDARTALSNLRTVWGGSRKCQIIDMFSSSLSVFQPFLQSLPLPETLLQLWEWAGQDSVICPAGMGRKGKDEPCFSGVCFCPSHILHSLSSFGNSCNDLRRLSSGR